MDAPTRERLKREMEAERDRMAPPDGFPTLPGIPAARYRDEAFFALERERLFGRTWLLVAHESELPDVGSFVSNENAGAPIVVVRSAPDTVRAFYNACQHRGAAVVREPGGRVRAFRCPYHAWTYDLEGRLVGRPDEHDFSRPREEIALRPVRCERWGGFVFVNLDPAAPRLHERLADVAAQLDDFRVDELVQVHKQSLELACNWKVAVEAFLEVYHLEHVHPDTAGALLDHRATTIALLRHGHSRMVSRKKPGLEDVGFKGPGMPEIEGIGEIARTCSLSYTIFPNLVTPLDVAGFPFLLMWPIDVRTTRLEIRWFGPSWQGDRPAGWDAVLRLFDIVTAEDTANLAWIQKSIESKGFDETRLGYQERRIYHLHESIDRAIGPDDVPEPLRIPPLLEAWIEGHGPA